MDMDLIEQLSAARDFPREALQRATEAPDIIAEAVLTALSKAAENPDAVDDHEANLLFWGLHVLAAARDTRAYGPLMRLLRQDNEAVDRVLNSASVMTTGRLIVSAFDGDPAPLHALILDKAVDGFARYDGFKAFAVLTRQGRLPLDDARTLLVRFDGEKAAEEGDMAWVGWEEVIAYLGLDDLAPRVEAARRDSRITDEFSDLAWFRKALRQASAEPPDLSEFGDDYGTLDDPVAALEWLGEDSDSLGLSPEALETLDRFDFSMNGLDNRLSGRPVVNPFKDVGRNDPCPCGSGKKYKKCCLDTHAVQPPDPS